MWHVIVLILKIIGISLLVILGLLLLLLLLALFVPVRYGAEAKKQEELWCRVRISWLCRLVSIPIVYDQGELSLRLKLFGITVKDLLAEEKETEGESPGDGLEECSLEISREKTKDSPGDREKQMECSSGSSREVRESEDAQKRIGTAGTEASPDLPGNEKTGEEAGEAEAGSLEEQAGEVKAGSLEEQAGEAEAGSLEEQAGAGKKKEPEKKKFSLKRIFSLIWDKLKKLKYTIQSICAKIRAGIKKAGKIRGFLLEETTKAAFGRGLGQLLYLLKKLGPRKIQGWIHFGTGDPALTGELLGGISALYAASPVRLRLQPDFEKRVLEGEIRVKGHLHLITVVGIAWRLWRDKNMKTVYKRIKRGF